MSEKLYIEGVQVTFINKIALSKRSINVTNFATQTLNYSKNVRIERTQTSSKIFSNAGNLNSTASKFNRFYDFHYEQSGQVVFKGVALLDSAKENYFNVQLLDLGKEFFDSLSAPLSDLDFDSDDFLFNTTNYDILKVATSSCWVWPVVCNHIDAATNNTILAPTGAKTTYSRPYFNIGVIYDKIFDAQGWSVNDENRTLLDTMCLSSNHDAFYITSYEKTWNSQVFNPAGRLSLSGFSSYDYVFFSNQIFQDGNDSIIIVQSHDTAIRFKGNITSTSDVQLEIRRGLTAYSAPRYNYIIKEGTHDYDILTPVMPDGGGLVNINIELVGSATVTFNSVECSTVIEEQQVSYFSGSLIEGIQNNPLLEFKVRFRDNAPSLTQLDFLKQIWSITGAFIDVDNLNKSVTVKHLSNVSSLNSIDYSNKFIRVTRENMKLTGLNQTNYLEYDNDSFVSNNKGRNYITTNDETLNKEGTIFKSIWGASDDIELQNTAMTATYQLAYIPVYATQDERLNTVNPRVLSFYTPTGANFTVAKFADLDFSELVNENFSLLVNAFENPEILTAEFDLSDTDFFTFDFTKVVYIKEMGSVFFVLEVNDYIINKTTEVVLLKVL